jgi:hypothetical protein
MSEASAEFDRKLARPSRSHPSIGTVGLPLISRVGKDLLSVPIGAAFANFFGFQRAIDCSLSLSSFFAQPLSSYPVLDLIEKAAPGRPQNGSD